MTFIFGLLTLCVTAWDGDYDIPPVVTLTPSNHVSVIGVVTDQSVTGWNKQLAQRDADIVYVYINSPGGSVTAGNTFIQTMDYHAKSGKKIACIADFAASMAFAILQACPYRLGTRQSVAMQHQMSLLLGGPLGNVRSRINFATSIEQSVNEMQAVRLEMSTETFEDKIKSDWWIYGSNLILNHAVDKLITVGCSDALEARRTGCPLSMGGADGQHEVPTRVYPMFELWLEHQLA